MTVISTLAITLAFSGAAPAQPGFKLVPTRAMTLIGYYMPQALTLSTERPAGLTGGPTGEGVLYGTIKFGPRAKPNAYVVALQDTDEANPALYIDRNHDNKLTESERVAWKGDKRTMQTQDGQSIETLTFSGSTMLDKGGKSYGISMYRFSRADEARRKFTGQRLLYYRDYAMQGKVTLGNKTYDAILDDEAATGDFSVVGETDKHVKVLFDLNGNGKFGERGERFAVTEPFNVAGTTYEIAELSTTGDRASFKKSSRTVAEVKQPPSFSVGGKVPSFTAIGVDGNPVNFPNDYRGKLVLLDFWATWCGPCVAEIPNVVATYGKYHDKGFEILGISLDQEGALQKLKDFTKEKEMPWRQVFDGKYWQAAVAVQYGIESIPHMFLIDGNTGKIIAHGDAIRGEKLGEAVDAALSAKSH